MKDFNQAERIAFGALVAEGLGLPAATPHATASRALNGLPRVHLEQDPGEPLRRAFD
jgi:hypothetical protein